MLTGYRCTICCALAKEKKKAMGPEVIKYLLLQARLLDLPLFLIKIERYYNQRKAFCSDDRLLSSAVSHHNVAAQHTPPVTTTFKDLSMCAGSYGNCRYWRRR